MTSSRLRSVRAALAVTICLSCLVGAVAATGDPAQPASAQNGTVDPEVDTTVTRISVAENGSARWQIEVRTRLDDQESVEQYEAYQERFRANRSEYLDSFSRRMSGAVENAETVTGREMNATAFDAETSIQELPRRWGVVTYSFTWRNFAATEGDALVVGDAFEGGFYLSAGDSLIVEPPPGYAVGTASPRPDRSDEGSQVWTDRRDFEDGEPAVRFVPAADSETEGARTDDESAAGSAPPYRGIVGVLVALAVVGVAYSGWRGGRLDGLVDRIGANSEGAPNDNADATADSDAIETTAREPEDGTTTREYDERTPVRDADADDSAATGDILTDEDRVRRLLADEGGRVKQQRIADEFDWSASKTSRVLSSMADEGTVEKLRIGRENVIDLLEE